MRYGLTGATGFVGGVLTRQLVEAGHEVVALVRTPARARDLADLGVELVEGDLDSDDALDRLLSGADGLFHVAGWYKLGERDPSPGRRVNVEGTRNVLSAALRAGTPKVVHTSTLAINSDTGGALHDETHRFTGDHLSEYDRTKAQAHEVAHEMFARGLPVVSVMPGAVYGPGDTSQVGELVAQVVAGRRVQVPSGGGTLMWAHVGAQRPRQRADLGRSQRRGVSLRLPPRRARCAFGRRLRHRPHAAPSRPDRSQRAVRAFVTSARTPHEVRPRSAWDPRSSRPPRAWDPAPILRGDPVHDFRNTA